MKEFSKVKLTLSSPEEIRKRSYGEVTKPETINYRSLQPESNGLFCEAIFGTTKDWSCSCGKYKRIRYKGIVCEKCGVEVTKAKVRRERMGHIELAAPVAHIWYLKGIPNNMGIILNVAPKHLESVAYFSKYIVIDKGSSKFVNNQVIDENEYNAAIHVNPDFKAGMGAEALLECLEKLDLPALKKELTTELANADSIQKKKKLVKRLELVKSIILSGNKPEWMILQALPVMPADLRPMVQLDGGRFATSDLNDLYRRVINRNKRLKKLNGMFAPEIILRNEKRMLQEAVDALIDNSKRDTPSVTQGSRDLKSLTDTLKGKQGRFRQNLLGKRVDYSGRSVIVVGPELKLNQCGLPKKMALELYKPFIMRGLIDREIATNIKSAKRILESENDIVWPIVEDVIKNHPVLLNRPPSLHKFSIQAFDPVLVEGKAIKLHPLVCSGFNADFDGDQLAVHVPLSPESIVEAKLIMLAANNLISPASGKPILSPSREMLMGCYYVTTFKKDAKGSGKNFESKEAAILSYEADIVAINAPVNIIIDGALKETTVGRVMFNELLPEDLRDYSKVYVGKGIGDLISNIFINYGATKTAEIVNNIKDFGFKFGTSAGITIGIEDLVVPSSKSSIIDEASKDILKIDEKYSKGEIISSERYREIVDRWSLAVENVVKDLVKETHEFNPVLMMSKSGARGGLTQMRQLSGMRGQMSDTQGRPREVPIKSNFRQGLTPMEFFMSSYGARKGSADKALRTADSGYLTRRLVDVAHDVIVTEDDCKTKDGILVKSIESDGIVVQSLAEKLIGRTLAADIVIDGEVIAKSGVTVNEEQVNNAISKGLTEAYIRSPVTCKARKGVCVSCYGLDLSTYKQVVLGEAVGVIAAQSAGEPGTQLTMRTFHTGGVSERSVAVRDIKSLSSGTVKFHSVDFVENSDGNKIITKYSRISIGSNSYDLEVGSILKVNDGDKINKNDVISVLNPYTVDYVSEVDGYIDHSEIVISERVDVRFGVKEKRVVNSVSGDDVAYLNIRKSKKGDIIAKYPLYSGSYLLGNSGDKVSKGDILAKTLKEEKKSNKDITGSLPRVQQLLEIRTPQAKAIISEIDGVVDIQDSHKKGMKVITVTNDIEAKEYTVPATYRIDVETGSKAVKGQRLTEGSIFVGDILKIKGVISAQSYIVESVQQIYREQGVKINDKHIEIIVKQMFKKAEIIDSGDSNYLEGEIVSLRKILDINSKLDLENKRLIKYQQVVQGITKAAIATESFISAASFQETTKVLANAAIRGSVDTLEGLKENVIVGRRIPSGTGFKAYRTEK